MAEMFHEGEGLISPTHPPPCTPVSFSQAQTIDSQHTLAEETSYVFLLQMHGNTRTCMVVEMLARERPSRSDSRLAEMADGWEFTGADETKETQGSTLNSWMQQYIYVFFYFAQKDIYLMSSLNENAVVIVALAEILLSEHQSVVIRAV